MRCYCFVWVYSQHVHTAYTTSYMSMWNQNSMYMYLLSEHVCFLLKIFYLFNLLCFVLCSFCVDLLCSDLHRIALFCTALRCPAWPGSAPFASYCSALPRVLCPAWPGSAPFASYCSALPRVLCHELSCSVMPCSDRLGSARLHMHS